MQYGLSHRTGAARPSSCDKTSLLKSMTVATIAFSIVYGRDILVIDAGTCITYEFIDAAARYHGGNNYAS